MCAKLGIVTGMDLAQATKALVGKRTAAALWVTTELAIIATEIAEVIGSAIALGIVGATVMPHNLYLHSSIVQSHQYDRSDERAVKEAIRYATIDSNVQLGFSFIIN